MKKRPLTASRRFSLGEMILLDHHLTNHAALQVKHCASRLPSITGGVGGGSSDAIGEGLAGSIDMKGGLQGGIGFEVVGHQHGGGRECVVTRCRRCPAAEGAEEEGALAGVEG